MQKIVNLLTSQRFWVALVTVAALIAKEVYGFEVDIDALAAAILTIAALIIGISIREPTTTQ